jgi:hypothetical protein
VRAPTRSFTLFLAALSLAAAGASCTGETTTTTTDASPTGSPLPTVDVPVDFVPGEFVYVNNDVKVSLSWEGGTGEMTIENASGHELGTPGLYAVTREQTEVPAEIPDAAPIPDGQSVTLEVSFPDSLDAADAGLIAILFGEENWGAFSPVIEE